MLRFIKLLILASLLALACKQMPAAAQEKPQTGETRYLAFQIFTSSPDPKRAVSSEGLQPLGNLPDKSALRPYVDDIKGRIGTVGAPNTRLAVIFGPISFDHTDAEVTRFIDMAFRLALETDVAVGFHLDDSMFWAKRKDLWSDPKNVEAMDWDGTPSTGRRLDWGRKPSEAPPQMCFNSKAILREVQQRSTLIGKAIQAGVRQLQQRNRPELFAGVIAGWETMIGQDFQTNKYLGYRALLNRGFSRQHPPQDMDGEREKVVQEFIEHWTDGLAEAGVSPQKIYSHTAFLSHRTKAATTPRTPTRCTTISRRHPWLSARPIGPAFRPTRSPACTTTSTRNWPPIGRRQAGPPAKARTSNSAARRGSPE
jgi:hypothetical protein